MALHFVWNPLVLSRPTPKMSRTRPRREYVERLRTARPPVRSISVSPTATEKKKKKKKVTMDVDNWQANRIRNCRYLQDGKVKPWPWGIQVQILGAQGCGRHSLLKRVSVSFSCPTPEERRLTTRTARPAKASLSKTTKSPGTATAGASRRASAGSRARSGLTRPSRSPRTAKASPSASRSTLRGSRGGSATATP